MNISVFYFVSLIFEAFSSVNNLGKIEEKNFLEYAHRRGWLEDKDQRFSGAELSRRDAARIIHSFLQLELKQKDLPDIEPALKLADIYTCHLCVNHIAQVFCRGIMTARQVERDGKIYTIFDSLAGVSENEGKEIIKRTLDLCSSY